MNGWDSKFSVPTFYLNIGVRCGGRSLLLLLLLLVLLLLPVLILILNTITIIIIAIAVEDGRQHQRSAHEWLGLQAQRAIFLCQHLCSLRRTVTTSAATATAIVTCTDANT